MQQIGSVRLAIRERRGVHGRQANPPSWSSSGTRFNPRNGITPFDGVQRSSAGRFPQDVRTSRSKWTKSASCLSVAGSDSPGCSEPSREVFVAIPKTRERIPVSMHNIASTRSITRRGDVMDREKAWTFGNRSHGSMQRAF